MTLSRQPKGLEEINKAALQNSTDPVALERLKRMCVLYAGRPGAIKRQAHLAYTRITGMIKQCQESTSQTTKATAPSTTSGSQKEVQADSSSN